MELTQLKYFIEVAQCENISVTAKKLFISQPALSTAIARLEADLGVKLFNRYTNKIVLTPEGKIFLKYVHQSLDTLNAGVNEVRSLSYDDKQQFTVISSFGITSEIINNFKNSNPNITIDVLYANHAEICKSVIKEEADFGISLFPINDSRLQNTCIMKGKFCAAFPINSNIMHNTITLEQLSEYRLFCSKLGATKQVAERLFSDKGINIDIIELDAKDFLFEAVSKNLGVVICMPMLYNRQKHQKTVSNFSGDQSVEFVPISNAFKLGEICLVTKKGLFKSKTTKQLIKFVSDYFRKNESLLNKFVQSKCDQK